jgi:hypothetical protein
MLDQVFDYELRRRMPRLADRQGNMIEVLRRLQTLF